MNLSNQLHLTGGKKDWLGNLENTSIRQTGMAQTSGVIK